MKSQPNAPNAKAGMYTLNEDIDIKQKLQLWQEDWRTLGRECPTILAMREMFGDQANKSINAQLSQRIDSIDKNGWMQNDLSQKIDNLQYSISRLTNLNTVQEKGKFPSQPHQNPKGIHEVEAQEGESSQ
ncbi:hypothetical protein CK203_110244 [Vitis vinifera]|uniref:Uncharacterized protein n=1 Tax=Vitis vinifera TaxID=29760 RepID=A0A438CW02_VITVI|nr:hypothetical protein CK203_110244 [Vitis vinifera]